MTLPPLVAAAVLDHARAALPNEACGLIAGSLATGRATAFHPARNAAGSPLRFELHPDDLLRGLLAIEASEEDLLAVFHSHVGSEAVPSRADLRGAAFPDALLLLVEMRGTGPESATSLRAWRPAGGRLREVAVAIGYP